jgi:hypothetical protein
MVEVSTRRQASWRRQPLHTVVLIAVLSTGICLGAAIVHAYDTRLDEAVAVLQKAAALVDAASAGTVTPRTQRRFDQHIDKALSSIEEAMGHIVAAGVAADSNGGQ